MGTEAKALKVDRFERKNNVDPTEPPGPASEGSDPNLTNPENSPRSTTGGKRGSDELSDLGHPDKRKIDDINRK